MVRRTNQFEWRRQWTEQLIFRANKRQTAAPWLLIPLQIYAALNILLVGYSRVYEGSHWLTDALGGYLAGVLFLALLILLYRWTLDRMTKRHARRLLEKSAQNQQA